ncbi:excalibur calcium-binding domain-containing protein [Nocardia sp. NBC_01009]|uniref:excalibur calcium-binding domain-containing protein n=1 Tax=Nocardia sp. NBC_01009 TaxID=2975996 RepID=UPI00386C781C|nr:excalibur calcium-binding domain-containing protein [Nocardia sp. NBC_01009]
MIPTTPATPPGIIAPAPPAAAPAPVAPPAAAPAPTTLASPSVYYPNCAAARAAGAAPLRRGEPGYSSKLDRDNDGIACE